MKPLFFNAVIFILLFCKIAYCQTITNVFAKQDGQNVLITYNLQCDGYADISVYVSEKGDGTFAGPLKSVTGDAGSGITSGNKTITWNTLQDQELLSGSNIVFRIKGVYSKFGTFTDSRDGKTYKTVRIGNQTWMAENLAYKPESGNYWAYDNSESNLTKYGYLYDWETAKNVCPAGWHLPSKEEFETLLQNVGGSGSNAYNALKLNGNSGFSFLMGGETYKGKFATIGTYAVLWSSTTQGENMGVWGINIRSESKKCVLTRFQNNSTVGESVRCIKD